MATLTEEQQRYIVICLACRYGYAETARRVLEEFDVKIDRGQVRNYNPDPIHNAMAHKVAPKWVELYRKTQAAYDAEIRRIGIASATRRAELWEQAILKALNKGQLAIAIDALDKVERIFGEKKPAGAGSEGEAEEEALPDPDTEPGDYMERVIGRDLAHAPVNAGPFGRRA